MYGYSYQNFLVIQKKRKKMVPKKSGAMKPSENLPLGSSRDFPYGQKLCATLVLVRVCLFPASKLESPNVNKATAGIFWPETLRGLCNSVNTKNPPRTLAKLHLPAIIYREIILLVWFQFILRVIIFILQRIYFKTATCPARLIFLIQVYNYALGKCTE